MAKLYQAEAAKLASVPPPPPPPPPPPALSLTEPADGAVRSQPNACRCHSLVLGPDWRWRATR